MQLSEGTQSDIDIFGKARDILNRLTTQFRQGNARIHYGLSFTRFGDGRLFWTIRGSTIGLPGDAAQLWFRFTRQSAEFVGASGFYSRFEKSGDPVITIHCIQGEDSPENLALAIRTDSDTRGAIIHELIHYLDDTPERNKVMLKSKTDDDQEIYKKSENEYFNQPTELNAYTNNLAEPLLRFLTIIDRREIAPASIVQAAEQYRIKRNFNDMLPDLVARTTPVAKIFWENLNVRNRRAVIRRLYRLHAIAMQHIQYSQSNK